MSALGQKATCAPQKVMSALAPKRTYAVQMGMSALAKRGHSLDHLSHTALQDNLKRIPTIQNPLGVLSNIQGLA
jgi:hypothetical protein